MWLLLLILFLIQLCLSKTSADRMPRPPMGWSTWESFAKDISEDKILKNVQILTSSGLQAAGYTMIQIDDGWMDYDIRTGWVSRINFPNLPNTRKGANGFPIFPGGDLKPGCLLPDLNKFPRGMKALGDDLHQLGFKWGLYSSGETSFCGAYTLFYASSPNYNLRSVDAQCFIDYGVDLLKIDKCNPPLRRESPAYEGQVLTSWRQLLPDTISIYNCRYGCQARTRCGNIIRCPLQTNIRRNSHLDSFCLETSDLARLGTDIKPRWKTIIENLTTRFGRGRTSRPGFWSDPDYLVPNERFLSYKQIRSQFSAWCILSCPLLISVNLEEMSSTVISLLKNPQAIEINQNYYGGDAGDIIYQYRGVRMFKKNLSSNKMALMILNVGPGFGSQSSSSKSERVKIFNRKQLGSYSSCQMTNIWDNTVETIYRNFTLTIQIYDSVLFTLTNCEKYVASSLEITA